MIKANSFRRSKWYKSIVCQSEWYRSANNGARLFTNSTRYSPYYSPFSRAYKFRVSPLSPYSVYSYAVYEEFVWRGRETVGQVISRQTNLSSCCLRNTRSSGRERRNIHARPMNLSASLSKSSLLLYPSLLYFFQTILKKNDRKLREVDSIYQTIQFVECFSLR